MLLGLLKGHTEPTIIHTDQGSVYSSMAYNELIRDTNIVRSMSRARKPTDNPVNEALNGWIGELPRRDTFESRVLTPEPKFVQKRRLQTHSEEESPKVSTFRVRYIHKSEIPQKDKVKYIKKTK